MAQTQVKPKTGGSFTNVPPGGAKATAGIVTLPPYQKAMAAHGANLYAISGGNANQWQRAAVKYGDAAGVAFQWA